MILLEMFYNIYFHKKVDSELESVDVIDTRYNFHTHPKEAYINHNCDLGWPSTDDLITFTFFYTL